MAVVRQVNYLAYSASSSAYFTVAGIDLDHFTSAAALQRFGYECRHVLKAGETVVAYLDALAWAVYISGYELDA